MKLHEGTFVCNNGEYDIIDCETCGFKHVYPLPTHEELENIYKNEYYTNIKPEYFDNHQRDHDWWMLSYSARLQKIGKNTLSEGKKFLDVGSGPGLMLEAAVRTGWDAMGLEPNVSAFDFARSRGCNVVNGFLTQDIAAQLGKFDAIHSSEVLEHIRDPAAMIALMVTMLNPGGSLCIVVPNDFNPLQKALVSSRIQNQWWVAPPYHLNYFSHASLKNLLQKNGLEVTISTSTFPIELFLLMGDNYVGNDELGAACHSKRKTMEAVLIKAGYQTLLDDMYQKFANLEIGREIVMVATKKSA